MIRVLEAREKYNQEYIHSGALSDWGLNRAFIVLLCIAVLTVVSQCGRDVPGKSKPVEALPVPEIKSEHKLRGVWVRIHAIQEMNTC